MRYATTPQVSRLTGLSIETLREWTSRRSLIPADVRPAGRGSPAKYTWQTVLLLRLAVLMRDRFHLELHANRALFASLRDTLSGMSFLALWNKKLALYDGERWELVSLEDSPLEDAILINMNPHLQELSTGFSLPDPAVIAGQLDLFPVQAIANGARLESGNVSGRGDFAGTERGNTRAAGNAPRDLRGRGT